MTLNILKSALTNVALILPLTFFLNAATFAKMSAITELHQTGLYGRIHTWSQSAPKPHGIEVKVPYNAPIIISDYHSSIAANGLRRSGKHHGVDIFAKTGTPVIAAADGQVIRAKVDKCWGPTVLINHGLDKNGRRFYALYGHMKNTNVSVGQHVKRGQKIAEMGDDIFTSCGAGLHHLHFQISYDPRKIPLLGWGWANFVMDGARAPNPHKYWANGEGEITCFEEGKIYSKSGLTYPLPCNSINKKISDETLFVQRDKSTFKQEIISSLEKASNKQPNHQERSMKTAIPIVQLREKPTLEYASNDTLERNFLSPIEEAFAEKILEEVDFLEPEESTSVDLPTKVACSSYINCFSLTKERR